MLVIDAPTIAPMIVNISRYIAALTLAIFSLTYETADPLEVAIIVTMLAAIAYFTGTPRTTSNGMVILPPPKPVNEPINPAGIEISSIVSISTNDCSYCYRNLFMSCAYRTFRKYKYALVLH